MISMMRTYLRAAVMPYIKSERGVTAVEYGLIVAAIAAVIITVVFALGGKVEQAFDSVNENWGGGGGGGEPPHNR